MKNEAMGRIAAFCSYAHEDKQHLSELRDVLAPLREEAIIDEWTDGKIAAGMRWDSEIKEALEKAHLVLFIVTPDLLKSRYVNEHEIPLSLARLQDGKCEVVPILVAKPEDEELWHANPLAALQPLPDAGAWVDKYRDPRVAYDAIRLGIREACKRIGGGDNPYRRSSVGDWRHVQRRVELPTGQTAKWEFTEELVEKTDIQAVVLIETTKSGQLVELRIEYDLTKALSTQEQSVANQVGIDMSGLAAMSTRAAADGIEVSEEVVKIGFNSYQTRVGALTSHSEMDGLTMETRARSWRSIDVPFDGAVRGTLEFSWSNGARGKQSMTLLGFGFGNAPAEKPKPQIHGAMPPEVAAAMGAVVDKSATYRGGSGAAGIMSDPIAKLKAGFSKLKTEFQESLAQQQTRPAIFPGRWSVKANDAFDNLIFDVILYPNFQLQGVCWQNAVQSQLTGRWGFEPITNVLRIDVNAETLGYPPSQYWVTFQITGSDSTAYTALDMNGRPFRIWMIQG